MTTSSTDASGQPVRPRLSGLALGSLVLGMLGLLTFGLTAVVGLGLGTVARWQIVRSRGALRGRDLAAGGIGVSALMMLGAFVMYPSHVAARESSMAKECCSNLLRIEKAKQQWATNAKIHNPHARPSWSDLSPYVGQKPECPKGGSYEANDLSKASACSVGRNKQDMPYKQHILDAKWPWEAEPSTPGAP